MDVVRIHPEQVRAEDGEISGLACGHRAGAMVQPQLVGTVGGVAAQCVVQPDALTGHQWHIVGVAGPLPGQQRFDLDQRRPFVDVDRRISLP